MRHGGSRFVHSDIADDLIRDVKLLGGIGGKIRGCAVVCVCACMRADKKNRAVCVCVCVLRGLSRTVHCVNTDSAESCRTEETWAGSGGVVVAAAGVVAAAQFCALQRTASKRGGGGRKWGRGGEGRKLVGDSQKLSVQLPPLASNTHGTLSIQTSAGNDRYEARS